MSEPGLQTEQPMFHIFSRRTVLQAGAVAGALGLVSQSAGARPAGGNAELQAPRRGPQRTGRFTVQIDGVDIGGWRSVTIPSSSTEVGEYREGEEEERKLWGQTTFDDLEMERGVQPGDTRLLEWRDDIVAGKIEGSRRDIVVTILDEDNEPMFEWEFLNAWIKDYDPPDLDAGSDDILTENVALAYDQMNWDSLA